MVGMSAMHELSGSVVGFCRNSTAIDWGHSCKLAPCPIAGNSKKYEFVSVSVADRPHDGGVAGSNCPASTSAGRSEVTGSFSMSPPKPAGHSSQSSKTAGPTSRRPAKNSLNSGNGSIAAA